MDTPPGGFLLLREATLRDFCREILANCGVPPDHARLVSDSLVAAGLRGVDSHGVQLLPTYVAQLEAEAMDPNAVGKVVSESGVCLTYDGENALGQVVAEHCTEHALRLVGREGLAMVVARHSNHFGAAAHWAQKLARAGHIGIVVTNASPAIAPWQGQSPRLGTNPICMAVPRGQSGRWILDMATTTVALGKASHAAYAGQPSIPAAWGFLDSDRNPTTDTSAAMKGFATPVGGYKGSGLAMMVEILCAVLGGGPMATEVAIFREGREPLGVSHMFLAMDPTRFLGREEPGGAPARPPGDRGRNGSTSVGKGLDEFEARMDRLQSMIKSSEPASGYDEVLIAGEPEWRSEEKRRREGTPIPAGLWRVLSTVAQRHNVVPPAPGPDPDQAF